MTARDDLAVAALARALVRTGMYVDAGIDTSAGLDKPQVYAAAILTDPDLFRDGLNFVMIESLLVDGAARQAAQTERYANGGNLASQPARAGVRDPEEPRLGDGPIVGPLTPKQVRILDSRHHRTKASNLCACGSVWAYCHVHRLVETLASRPSPDLSAALDVERLARAMRRVATAGRLGQPAKMRGLDPWKDVDAIAREYAALTPDPNPETTP